MALIGVLAIISNNKRFEIDGHIREAVISAQQQNPQLEYEQTRDQLRDQHPSRKFYAIGSYAFPVILIVSTAGSFWIKRSKKK